MSYDPKSIWRFVSFIFNTLQHFPTSNSCSEKEVTSRGGSRNVIWGNKLSTDGTRIEAPKTLRVLGVAKGWQTFSF
jgi:hypothetical protein